MNKKQNTKSQLKEKIESINLTLPQAKEINETEIH